ncbi:MAG: hypothetical protein JO232_01150 [Verrucomicrobia bacterium]|nr:hypothetical protein [Verrucomicrobiota bacterium]
MHFCQLIVDDRYLPSQLDLDARIKYGLGHVRRRKQRILGREASSRIFVDPNDPKDGEEVHKLQDAIKVQHRADRVNSSLRIGTLQARRKFAMRF